MNIHIFKFLLKPYGDPVCVYTIVVSSTNKCRFMICLLAFGPGSTYVVEVNAAVTYDNTSGKEEYPRAVDSELRDIF